MAFKAMLELCPCTRDMMHWPALPTRLSPSSSGVEARLCCVAFALRVFALTCHIRAANAKDDGLVCTVGQFVASPGASNVIAGAVNLTVDIRSRDDSVRLGAAVLLRGHASAQPEEAARSGVVADVTGLLARICEDRQLSCTIVEKVRLHRIACLRVLWRHTLMLMLGRCAAWRRCAGLRCAAQ